MNKKSFLPILGIFIFSSILFLSTPKQAHANFFDDIFNKVREFFTPTNQQITITPTIGLASKGSASPHGQFNAGDTLRFSFRVNNTTDKTFPFVTLKTSVPTNVINSLHNIQGALSVVDTNHVITIPHIFIKPHQQFTISFDATSNFNKNTDQLISTNPEIISQDNTIIGQGQKVEAMIHKLDTGLFNKLVHVTP